MSDIINFNIQGARAEFGDEKTLNYLRKDLNTNINWDEFENIYKDNAKAGLDALEASNYTIYGKNTTNYDIYKQGQKQSEALAPTQLKDINYKTNFAKEVGYGALDIVSNTFDVKEFVNPLYKAIFDKDLPQNILKSQQRIQYEKDMENNAIYKMRNGIDLNADEISYAQKYLDNGTLNALADTSVTRHINDMVASGKDLKEQNKFLQNFYKEKQDIMDTQKYEDLTQNQKLIIDTQTSTIDKIADWFGNTSDQERLENYKEEQLNNIITKGATQALIFLENTEPHTDIFSAIAKLGNSKEDNKKRTQYLDAVQSVALSAGFSGVATDKKNNVYFFKENENGEKDFYKPNKDFFANWKSWITANAGSMAGSIYGFSKGLKSGNIYKATAYGAVGAFGGGMLDYAIASAVANRKNNFSDMIRHAVQEGALNVVVDIAGIGLSYAGNKALNAIKNKDIGNIIGTATDYMPVLGLAKRWQSGNAQSGYKIINDNINKDDLVHLREYAKNFGGELHLGEQTQSRAFNVLKERFGENSSITKSAKWLESIFTLKNQSQAQKDFLQALRADESGNLSGFITQVAKDSPQAHTNLSRILHLTTHNLTKRLEQLNLDSINVKDIFTSLEKGTKKDYKEAMEQVLGSVYDTNYKTIIDPSKYTAFRKELDSSGILPEDSMRFLNFVESNIYNAKGVTFSQLNNALKQINSYYKTSLDPNFKDFSKRAVESFLKDDIKQGIDSIFSQNKSLYKDAQTLFSTALQDYANMKDTIKTIDRLKLRDEATTKARALDNVYKYLQGQGTDVSNYAKITKSLNPQAKAMFELATLNGMFKQALITADSIKVFDSGSFFTRLGNLESVFESKEAKDFIEIAKGFHNLFKNDALIAQSLNTPITKEIGSSIATTIEGAVKFQIVKMLFESIMRLMPHIPFARGFNEKIQGMALRYHLRKALSQSSDISEFKFSIAQLKDNKSINSPTRDLLERITAQVDETQDEILEFSNTARSNALDSTQIDTQDNITSPFERALQEKQDSIEKIAQQLQQEEKLQKQKVEDYKKKLEEIDKQKQALAGLSANQRVLDRGQPIEHESIGVDSNLVLNNNKVIPLEYVKVKSFEIKPDFENNALQPRTNRQDKVIDAIAKEFNPSLMIGVGGFRDLPIITQWGGVISGNHRLEGMLNFSKESEKAYKQAIKKTYGIDLQDNEFLVRMPKQNLSDTDLIDLAFSSNLDTTQNIGDKALANLGKYATEIKNLPKYLESESVEDLAYQVARNLEKDNAYPDIEGANLALLSDIAKNSNGKNIADVLNTLDISLDKESANKLKDMFVKNAGVFHNLVNNLSEAGLRNLELRPYLLDSISATAKMLQKERSENFGKLADDIQTLIKSTDENGTNIIVQNIDKDIYKNLISDLLGASLARFVRLENPAKSLYEVLRDTKSDLEE
ncbi:hypothetical protein, partial [Helicobacter equorum]|uniref:hypothetical protein n=1 Tax=Helicobacter equorum TaxID=361872 RepID=UPI000CF0523A